MYIVTLVICGCHGDTYMYIVALIIRSCHGDTVVNQFQSGFVDHQFDVTFVHFYGIAEDAGLGCGTII